MEFQAKKKKKKSKTSKKISNLVNNTFQHIVVEENKVENVKNLIS